MQPRLHSRNSRRGSRQRRRTLLADLARIARRLSADEWARQQQVKTLEKQIVACAFRPLGKAS
jgi:hypothetical protein